MSKQFICAHPGCGVRVSKENGGCQSHASNLSKKRKNEALQNELNKLKKEKEEQTGKSARVESSNSSSVFGMDNTKEDIEYLKSEVSELRKEIFLLKTRLTGNK